MKNTPILTVKLSSASISRGVGPDVRVKIKVADGPQVTGISGASRDKWLFQAPSTSSSVKIEIEVTEMDPVFPDTGKTSKTLSVDVTSPPKTGTDSAKLTVKAVGGDKPKTADFTFNFRWWVSSNADDIAEFIQQEMLKNVGSSVAQEISTINERMSAHIGRDRTSVALFLSDVYNLRDIANSFGKFYMQVNGGAPWDYKVQINPEYGKWALDRKSGTRFRFDVWGNLHFGYIGRAVGYSRELLLNAAGIIQARDDGKDMNQVIEEFLQSGDVAGYDQAEDQAAISSGCGLWDDFEDDVNTADILRRLRANRNNLATEEAPEGATPKAFLK